MIESITTGVEESTNEPSTPPCEEGHKLRTNTPTTYTMASLTSPHNHPYTSTQPSMQTYNLANLNADQQQFVEKHLRQQRIQERSPPQPQDPAENAKKELNRFGYVTPKKSEPSSGPSSFPTYLHISDLRMGPGAPPKTFPAHFFPDTSTDNAEIARPHTPTTPQPKTFLTRKSLPSYKSDPANPAYTPAPVHTLPDGRPIYSPLAGLELSTMNLRLQPRNGSSLQSEITTSGKEHVSSRLKEPSYPPLRRSPKAPKKSMDFEISWS